MEDLKPELYAWCEDEHHLDLQVAEDEDFSKPHIWLRFLDDVMKFNNWYAVELRHFDQEIDSNKVQHFVNTLPKGHKILHKIMISKVGFTQTATVMAGQLGVLCIDFGQDPQTRYYGYLEPLVTGQTIDSPEVLSQREWKQIHERLNDSRGQGATVEALVVDTQSEQQYTWGLLEDALPVIEPYETVGEHVYDLAKHRLKVTGFDPLPIERIVFKYSTNFRVLDGRAEAEALAELLERVIVED